MVVVVRACVCVCVRVCVRTLFDQRKNTRPSLAKTKCWLKPNEPSLLLAQERGEVQGLRRQARAQTQQCALNLSQFCDFLSPCVFFFSGRRGEIFFGKKTRVRQPCVVDEK